VKDLRFAVRTMGRHPRFFALVVVTLALGIGANLATFRVASAVLLAPLPYDEPDRLVSIWEANLAESKERERVAPPNFANYRALEGVFEDAAAWWHFDVNLTDEAGESLRVATVECTANLFSVLGVAPRLGPGFEVEGKLHDAKLAAVISDRLWRERYKSDPGIVGKAITLNGNLYTVAGVMKTGFRFPGDVDVWQRQNWDFSVRTRYAHFMEAVGRLRTGVGLEQAQADLTALSDRLAQEHEASNGDWRALVVPLHLEIVGEYGPALSVLMGAVGLLLLLATANVANLLLARGSEREREMGIRAAVGASPSRLLWQLLTEQFMLCTCAALVGGALAVAMVRYLVVAKPLAIPRLAEMGLDGRMLGFVLVLIVVTVLLFGALPAVQLARMDLRSVLKEGMMATSDGRRGGRTRSLLVIIEVALAMTLLVGAGLLIRSVLRLLEKDPGFGEERVVTVSLELPATVYPDWTRVSQFYSQVLASLEAHQAISVAGATSFLPFDPAWIVGYSVPETPPRVTGETLRAQYTTTSPGYFQTLGVPLLAGRMFDTRDRAESASVVLVNEELASRTWSRPADAVGETIRSGTQGFGPLGRAFAESREYEIIGVVGDLKNNGLENSVDPTVYFVHTQFPYRTMSLVMRGNGAVEPLVAVVRDEVKRLDAGLPLAKVQTLDELLAGRTARSRFVMALMTGFALLAVVLAATGIYGVLSYQVLRRRYEVAVRLSLGAVPRDVRSQVLLRGMLLVIAGLVLGTVLTTLLGQLMASLVSGISVSDGATMAAAAGLILAVALGACYLPARRASRMNPMDVLRT